MTDVRRHGELTIDELARETGHDRAQHPRAPVARAAAAARGPRAHRLLRARARRAPAADPGAAGRGLQPRGDQAPASSAPSGAIAGGRSSSAARCSRRSRTSARGDRPPRSWSRASATTPIAKLLTKAEKLGLLLPARRRPLRGPEPDAAARGRGPWSGWASRSEHALDVIESVAPPRRSVSRPSSSCSSTRLEAVRRGGAAGHGLAGRARRARAPAPARRRGAARGLPADDDPGDREGVRAELERRAKGSRTRPPLTR